jgi:hypothetical protein
MTRAPTRSKAARAQRTKAGAYDLGEDFLEALREDFRTHGRSAISKLREDKPADYLKAVAAYLPRGAGEPDGPFAGFSDAELLEALEEVRAFNRARNQA